MTGSAIHSQLRSTSTPAERILRHDRLLVLLGIGLILLLSWYYLLTGAGTGMSTLRMTTVAFPPPPLSGNTFSWSPGYWLLMLVMWWVMMIAMMLPSATPTLLLYARVFRHNNQVSRSGTATTAPSTTSSVTFPTTPTGSFLLGYLLVWLLFSIIATALQWLLEQSGLLHSMLMWSSNTQLSAGLLLTAGVYQFTGAKQTCLRHCRSPAVFLSRNWRPGATGALAMGFHHGLYCVACCWSLMLLLFVGGVMNLVWIAGLAILVLLEKVVPGETWLARTSGAVMCLAGLYLLLL